MLCLKRGYKFRSLLFTLTPCPDELEMVSYCDEDLMHLLSIFNIHIPSPPQGADKDRKGPGGISAFEAAESDAIKALLK